MYSEKSRQNINGKQKVFFLQIAFNNLVKFVCFFVCLFLTTLHLFSNNISSVVSFLSRITYMHGLTIKTFFFQCATELTFTIYGKKNLSKMNIVTSIYFFLLGSKTLEKTVLLFVGSEKYEVIAIRLWKIKIVLVGKQKLFGFFFFFIKI